MLLISFRCKFFVYIYEVKKRKKKKKGVGLLLTLLKKKEQAMLITRRAVTLVGWGRHAERQELLTLADSENPQNSVTYIYIVRPHSQLALSLSRPRFFCFFFNLLLIGLPPRASLSLSLSFSSLLNFYSHLPSTRPTNCFF